MLLKSTRIAAFIAIFCLAASYGFRLLSPSAVTSSEVGAIVSVNLQRELIQLEEEANQILSDSTHWRNVSHAFILIDSVNVLKWNRNDFIPDLRLVHEGSDIKWIQTSHGDFVLSKHKVTNGKLLVGILPLVKRYKIINNFLEPEWNTSLFPVSNVVIHDAASSGTPVEIADQKILFRIELSSTENIRWEWPVIFFWWIGIAAFLYALTLRIYLFSKSHQFEKGFLWLSGGLIFIRFVCIYFNVPGIYTTSSFFDPKLFASSSYNPSIGDLFLNTGAVCVLCVYLFFTYHRWQFIQKLFLLTDIRRTLMALLFIVICFFSVLFPFLYFETIFHNSSISLDITQSIQFDEIRILAFACIALSFIASFCFIHVFFRLFISTIHKKINSFFILLLAGALVLIVHAFLLERNYWITACCALVYFCIAYLFELTYTLRKVSYRTFFYLLAVIFLFAIQGAWSIHRFINEKKINSQFRFANEFLVGRDFLGEFLLNESVIRIKQDAFIQSSLANPFLSKSSVRQKVRQVHLNNYFDRYEVKIYLYNSVGEPLDTEPFLDFASQVKTYENVSSTTGYSGIYFTNDSNNQTDRRYLTIISMERSHTPIGFIVLELSVKKVVPRNVYPELLVDNRFAAYLRSSDYAYAIFSKGKLISSFGEFNFEQNFDKTNFSNPQLYREGITSNEFIHIGVEDDAERVAIVSSRAYPFFYVISNFSLWVVIGLSFVLIGLAFQGAYHWIHGQQINYSLRVQLYFYSSLLLPLLAVSVTTLTITTRSAANNQSLEYIDKSKLFGESLTTDLATLNDGNDLGRRIRELARISDVDATVYDRSGKLIGSSQPLIFDYHFKSEWMDHEAFDKIVYEKENSFVREDQIGSLKYYSAFCAVRSPVTGELLGIVSLPFFRSASSLEKTQISILTNLLTIFTAVLLLFSILSLFAADRLTYPLRIIANTLSRTTLTGHNEPLAWNSNDEIGVMVKEYNRMVQNLEQSKIELARSQKESAWREMAKQVAHEIKNPLTPMKLTLQQMEIQLKREDSIPKERGEQNVKMLLAQVEILNEIASSFSTFARMPSPVMTRLELNSVIKKTVDLYANNYSGKVTLLPCSERIFVLGDEQLLIRIFSNIILNALQSGSANQQVAVQVELNVTEQYVTVAIKDNGKGIPDELKEKIFTPYFTTKKSGSGLGLAIVKQGVEQSSGSIRMESQQGKGTTFYIRFPVAAQI